MTLPGNLPLVCEGDASFVPFEVGLALLAEEDRRRMEGMTASNLLNDFAQRAMANFMSACYVADRFKDLSRALKESELDRGVTNRALLVSMEKLEEEEKKNAELGKKKGEVEELRAAVVVGGKEELAQLRAELAVEKEELALVKAQLATEKGELELVKAKLMGERQESARLQGEVEGA